LGEEEEEEKEGEEKGGIFSNHLKCEGNFEFLLLNSI